MAWLKLEDTYYDHPKFLRLAKSLEIDEVTAHGHVSILWAWCLRFSPDGDLRSYTEEEISGAARWAGSAGEFCDSMVSAGLLEDKKSGYVVRGYLRRAESYKRAQRKALERKKEPEVSRPCRTTVATLSHDCRENVTGERRGEERTGEEKTTTARTTKPVALIPLADGTEFPVEPHDVVEWSMAYPGVGVEQELRKMRQWCLSYPKKRKTKRGVRGFITGWLGREQDRPKPTTHQQPKSRMQRSRDLVERYEHGNTEQTNGTNHEAEFQLPDRLPTEG
jgi:hypothetical protein